MKNPIPRAALDDRLGFIGTSGSGKTYSAGIAVEQLLALYKARVVIVDPLGVWWGLRLRADGKTPSLFNVAIFGGAHGDLPLTEHAGALIGETAATMAESCIIDLSELRGKSSERRFMTAFLDAIYLKATKEPFHLVVDEADLFAPQKPASGAETLLGHMEDIVRRGRVKGFIPWLISQRPAVINKNVLSQVDGLIAFKLTATQDRDALDDWIEGQADKTQGKEIKASLPTLQTGQGVVWLPGRGILTTAQFPAKVTFDSSRTPKRGEKVKSRKLKPLNVDTLKGRLATVEAEAKANNPAALRTEIARLKAEKAKLEGQVATAKPVADKAALLAAEIRGFEQAKKKFAPAAQRALNQAIAGMAKIMETRARELVGIVEGDFKDLRTTLPGLEAELIFEPSHSGPPAVTPAAAPKTAPAVTARPARQPSPAAGGDDGLSRRDPSRTALDDGSQVSRPEQLVLNAIRWWNVLGVTAPSHAQAAFIAGYSHRSGTWSTYLSRLRSKGLIEGRGDLVLTAEGASLAQEPHAPPTGDALRATVLEKIDTPLQKILRPLLAAYPGGLSHEAAAAAAGYSPQSGTWSTYLSRLRSLDLITGRGELTAEPWLFAA